MLDRLSVSSPKVFCLSRERRRSSAAWTGLLQSSCWFVMGSAGALLICVATAALGQTDQKPAASDKQAQKQGEQYVIKRLTVESGFSNWGPCRRTASRCS